MKTRLENPPLEMVLSPIERRAFSNYYWSFHHSQGNPDQLQWQIGVFIARQYQPAEIGTLSEFNDRMLPHVKKASIPTAHTRVYPDPVKQILAPLGKDRQREEFGEQWHYHRLIIQRTFGGTVNISDCALPRVPFHETEVFFQFLQEKSGLDENELLREILNTIVKKDRNYQETPRPNRKEGQDPHESFLREYAFGGNRTQTPELQKLYHRLREIIDRGDAPVEFELLVHEWEDKHPGEKFIPETTAA